ncbi:MAG TPA: hypothetical protein VNQ77_11760 [Frankiaceae bacterium]|nr:hypothetical protein [Frankiaceae bacterium]
MRARLILAAVVAAAAAVPLAGTASACSPRLLIVCVARAKVCDELGTVSPAFCTAQP